MGIEAQISSNFQKKNVRLKVAPICQQSMGEVLAARGSWHLPKQHLRRKKGVLNTRPLYKILDRVPGPSGPKQKLICFWPILKTLVSAGQNTTPPPILVGERRERYHLMGNSFYYRIADRYFSIFYLINKYSW